jgi:hypothetical protein
LTGTDHQASAELIERVGANVELNSGAKLDYEAEKQFTANTGLKWLSLFALERYLGAG